MTIFGNIRVDDGGIAPENSNLGRFNGGELPRPVRDRFISNNLSKPCSET